MTIQIPREHRRLFPLSLAPIDQFFYLDDFPDYPMSFYIELKFSGALDRGVFEAAFEEALSRHPLLFSRVEPGKRGRLGWVPDGSLAPAVQWRSWDTPLVVGPGEESIDLHKECGTRVWARHAPDQCEVTLQFHHAVSDGTGVYRFLGDLLVAYFSRMPETADRVEFGESDWGLLRRRRAKMGHLSERVGAWGMVLPVIREWLRHSRLITPLKAPPQPPAVRPFPNLAKHTFSADTSKRLRSAALAENAMLNDLLLCEFLRALSDWNEGKHGRLRLLVPSDMRSKEDFGMPAANLTAYTFVTRTKREVQSDDLLQSICQDMLEIKNGGPQQRFVDAVIFSIGNPQLFRMVLKHSWCLATAVLSNAGDPSKRFLGRLPRKRGIVASGDLSLDEITGAPPVRRKTRASLSASSYGRKLALTVRCDPNLFDLSDGQQLLDLYAKRLQAVADR